MNTNNTSSDKDCEKWIDIDHIPPPSKPLSAISLTPSIERLPAEEKGEGRKDQEGNQKAGNMANFSDFVEEFCMHQCVIHA